MNKNSNSNDNTVKITERDRLMKAWENSMELVRDFEIYSKEIHTNHDMAVVFARFAEDEGHHAAKFRELLLENQRQSNI